MSLWLDSRPLHGRRQGGSGERLPQGKLMCTLGGSLREQSRREENKKKRKKRRRRGDEEETKTEP